MALITGFVGRAAAPGLNVSCETAGADGFIGTYATLAIAPGMAPPAARVRDDRGHLGHLRAGQRALPGTRRPLARRGRAVDGPSAVGQAFSHAALHSRQCPLNRGLRFSANAATPFAGVAGTVQHAPTAVPPAGGAGLMISAHRAKRDRPGVPIQAVKVFCGLKREGRNGYRWRRHLGSRRHDRVREAPG